MYVGMFGSFSEQEESSTRGGGAAQWKCWDQCHSVWIWGNKIFSAYRIRRGRQWSFKNKCWLLVVDLSGMGLSSSCPGLYGFWLLRGWGLHQQCAVGWLQVTKQHCVASTAVKPHSTAQFGLALLKPANTALLVVWGGDGRWWRGDPVGGRWRS